MSDAPGSNRTSSLSLQCQICFNLLQGWIQLIRKKGNDPDGNEYSTALVLDIANQLDEHRLRIDIWMSDCKVNSVSLPTEDEEPVLHETISAKFKELAKHILQIGNLQLESIQRDTVDIVKSKFYAQSKEFSSTIRELAKLQSQIQMAQAVHRGFGPYSKIQKHVLAISTSLHEQDDVTVSRRVSHSVTRFTKTDTDNNVCCQRCQESFPLHVLPFHSASCLGETSRTGIPERLQPQGVVQAPKSTIRGILESRQNTSGVSTGKRGWLVQDATRAQCRSIPLRNELRSRAVRKDGDEANGGDKNLLFPPSRIKLVLTLERMMAVLACECRLCTWHGFERMFIAVTPREVVQDQNKHLGFAILVYMGATFAARSFFSHGLGTNGFKLDDAMRSLRLENNVNPPTFYFNFKRIFESTKSLFEPALFQEGSLWTLFRDDQSLPFLFENEVPSKSSSGKMYSCWLHKEFCTNLPSIDIPEGPPIDPDMEFPDKKLARKELRGSEAAFKSERSVLQFIAGGDHRHHKTSILVLEEGWLPHRQPAIPERFKASKLRHWLWEQILQVIHGLECVHTPGPHQDKLPENVDLFGGHFDIKPANILIDGNGQLVLADFGLAQIKSKSHGGSSTFTGPAGTFSYKPPPPASNTGDADHHWRRSYDVWSMACVMLEIVHFVLQGTGRVKAFIAEREDEERPNTKSSTFWKPGPIGPVLKKCVQDSLTQLKVENDRYLTMVAGLLERMFSIDPEARVSIKECLKELLMDNLTEPWSWKDEDEVSIGGYHTQMPLYKMNVVLNSMSANKQYYLTGCFLHIFRERSNENLARRRDIESMEVPADPLGDNIRVVINFEKDGTRHMVSERGIWQKEVLKPLTYFDVSQKDLRRPQQNSNSMACAFQTLHRNLILNFSKSRDYYRFQTAVTQQRVYEASHALIARCWISYKGLKWNKVGFHKTLLQKYGSGHVEIWKELDDREYYDEFIATMDTAHTPSLPSEEASRTSSERYNMPINPGRPTTSQAVATRAPRLGSTPRRLAIYLKNENKIITANLNTYIMMKSRCDHIENSRDDLCLSFIPHTGPGYKIFQTGMMGESRFKQEHEHRNTQPNFPGIPLDPNMLVEEDETKWLEIEFVNAQGKRNFVDVYNSLFQNFPDKQIVVRS